MDFSREKDGIIHKETPNLPIPSMTYDIYSISGQGTGGSFRPYRSHVGRVHDNDVNSAFGGGGIGVKLGAGGLYKIGLDLSQNMSFTQTGNTDSWAKDSDEYDFAKDDASRPVGYEAYFFKAPGEATERRVTPGSTLSNGLILVKAIDTNPDNPYIVLEQYGRTITRRLGDGVPEPAAAPQASISYNVSESGE